MSNKKHCGECDYFSYCADDVASGDWNGNGACMYKNHSIFTLTELMNGRRCALSVNRKDECHYEDE